MIDAAARGLSLKQPASARAADSVPSVDVVILLVEGYSDLQRRGFARPPGRLVEALLDDERVHHLTIVNGSRNALKYGLRRLQRRAGPLTIRKEGLTVMQPLHVRWRRPSRPSSQIRRQRSIDRCLGRQLGLPERRPRLAISFEIFFSGYATAGWATQVAHFARDDPSSFPGSENAGFDAAYAAFRAQGRPLLAVSPIIIERMKPSGRTWVIPNGVDPSEWNRDVESPAWLKMLRRPIALYSGTIDNRLDINLVVAASRALSEGTIVLLGPAMPDVRRTIADRCNNVVFQEARGRDELVGITRNVEVCLIPHVVTPQTASMSPLKLFEYLAAGRPVASIALPSTKGMGRIFEAGDEAGFEVAVRSALKAGCISEEEREAFLRENSWASRFRPAVNELIAEVTAEG